MCASPCINRPRACQTPWEITALTEPFTFFPGDGEIKPQEPEKSEAEWRKDLKSRSADEAYDIVIHEDNVIVYQLFLVLFPDAPQIGNITIILDRRLEMFAWFDAVRLNSVLAYEAFLARYPNSDLATDRKAAGGARPRARRRGQQLS